MESSDHTRSSAISYNILSGDITPNRPLPNLYNKKYNGVLEFKIEICKACATSEHFTAAEQQSIVRWLTSPYDYRKFKINDFKNRDYHKEIDYYCICTSYGETVINDSIIGMFFKFQCNAPYAFLEEEITEFTATSSAPATFTINNKSDELEEDYYPIVELTGTATGRVSIKNSIYPNETMDLSVLNGQTLYIDNGESDISDNLNQFEYSTGTNLVWLRLAPGNNIITVTGSCTGQVKCMYPRKVGI